MKKANTRSARGSTKSTKIVPVAKAPALVDETTLLADLRTLIKSARQRIATVANSTYTLLCWQVGRRLLRDNLEQGRAAYGKQILATVSQELTAEYGSAVALRSRYRAIQFCQCFTDQEIVSTLSTQLCWSHVNAYREYWDSDEQDRQP